MSGTTQHGTAPSPAADSDSPVPRGVLRRIRLTLELIKFSHTIFALPFALLAAAMAARGIPSARQIFWIVAACVFARSAAMAFNRLIDARYDAQNPRTRGWHIPAGRLSRRFVLLFCFVCCAGFVGSAWMLNPLAFALSPVALLILLGYSTTKRWTMSSHFFLGLALGIAPIGAWIGVRGELSVLPVLLGAGVLAWVAGFDIIYSCQDAAFDRRVGLFSLPSRLGKPRALAISVLCHAVCILLFAATGYFGALGIYYLSAVALAALLLAWEQHLIRPGDLSRLNTAFFTLNGWVSMLFFAGGLADLLLAAR
jgi:4-hydroxybenzoate polyprenyltransferase